MMDIVDRLKSRPNDAHMDTEGLLDDALDEIKTLRDQLAVLKRKLVELSN